MAWCVRLAATTYAHGSALADALREADNVATAETVLRELEADGMIERVRWDPTSNQRFFGCGGSPIGSTPNDHYTTCWSWLPTDRMYDVLTAAGVPQPRMSPASRDAVRRVAESR